LAYSAPFVKNNPTVAARAARGGATVSIPTASSVSGSGERIGLRRGVGVDLARLRPKGEGRDMSAVAERYRRLAAVVTERIDAIPGETWDARSPCADWTVRNIVRHLTETQGMFAGS
jgi:hypothetical protein